MSDKTSFSNAIGSMVLNAVMSIILEWKMTGSVKDGDELALIFRESAELVELIQSGGTNEEVSALVKSFADRQAEKYPVEA